MISFLRVLLPCLFLAVGSHLTALASVETWPTPLVLQRADPQITRHDDGWFYFIATVPEYDRIELRRAKTIGELASASPKTVWMKHAKGVMGAHIWAPELHWIDGAWYIYFAAGEAEKVWAIRMYALKNTSPNPLEGQWEEAGQIKTDWESFSLDATTFVHGGKRYLVWAQQNPAVKNNSNLYIAEMLSPVELRLPATCISTPTHEWEKVRYAVNEGPAVLVRNGRVWITYSASGTGAEYCLGLLQAADHDDLLSAASWSKSPKPVFVTDPERSIFGPGHNSFTTLPDGTDLLVYHARDYKDIPGDPLRDPNRHTRVQRFTWDERGAPDFGRPVQNNLSPRNP